MQCSILICNNISIVRFFNGKWTILNLITIFISYVTLCCTVIFAVSTFELYFFLELIYVLFIICISYFLNFLCKIQSNDLLICIIIIISCIIETKIRCCFVFIITVIIYYCNIFGQQIIIYTNGKLLVSYRLSICIYFCTGHIRKTIFFWYCICDFITVLVRIIIFISSVCDLCFFSGKG